MSDNLIYERKSADGSCVLRIEEDCEEHHMGCRTIWFHPQPAIGGVERFQTTNGHHYFVEPEPILILRDATMVLIYRASDAMVCHFTPPRGVGFRKVELDGRTLRFEGWGAGGVPKSIDPISLDELEKLPEGLGRLADGRFPSAFP